MSVSSLVFPENEEQFKQRIHDGFNKFYSPTIVQQLSNDLLKYFEYQQFDEWSDRQEDICDNFLDCCCKETVYNTLTTPNNDQERLKEYKRFKQCMNVYYGLGQKIAILLGETKANAIINLLKQYIDDEWDDIDTVIDDLKDQDDSSIWDHLSDSNALKDVKENNKQELLKCIQIAFGTKINNNKDIHAKNTTIAAGNGSSSPAISTAANSILNLIINRHDDIDGDKKGYSDDDDDDDDDDSSSDYYDDDDFDVHNLSTGNTSPLINDFDFSYPTTTQIEDVISNANKMCKEVLPSQGSNGNDPNYSSIMIAKTIEVYKNNGYPLLLNLVELFSRDRLQQYKKILYNIHKYKKSNQIAAEKAERTKKQQFDYAIRDWYKSASNKLCASIRNKIKSSKMSDIYMHSLPEICLRALPILPVPKNETSMYIVGDNLDMCCKYQIDVHRLIQRIQHDGNLPLQVDFMLIPQTIQKTVTKSAISQQQILQKDDDDTDDDDEMEKILRLEGLKELKKNILAEKKENNKCHLFGKSAANDTGLWFWDLKHELTQLGYIQNKDLFMFNMDEYNKEKMEGNTHIDIDEKETRPMKKLRNVWKQFKRSVGHQTQFRRIIIIVDRRDSSKFPINKPNYDCWKYNRKPDLRKGCDDDKIYLIIPKTNNKIDQLFSNYPESLFELSSKYMFPDKSSANTGFSIKESMNGHSFVTSYHYLNQDQCKMYWFRAGGAIRFELSDMKWLWKHYFVMETNNDVSSQNNDDDNDVRNKKFQRLSKETKNEIQNLKKKGLILKDVEFEKFKKISARFNN